MASGGGEDTAVGHVADEHDAFESLFRRYAAYDATLATAEAGPAARTADTRDALAPHLEPAADDAPSKGGPAIRTRSTWNRFAEALVVHGCISDGEELTLLRAYWVSQARTRVLDRT